MILIPSLKINWVKMRLALFQCMYSCQRSKSFRHIEADEIEEILSLSHKNYEYMAKKIIENIGGKENIISFQNCITRLRIELKRY